MALGKILQTAREQKGLTVSQVADGTRMMSQVVEELEREDFHRFAAAIYGRGFVKLYAEFLGIEAAPLIAEFNELYSGARRPQIATRVLSSVAADEPRPAAPAPAAAPAAPAPLPAEAPPKAPVRPVARAASVVTPPAAVKAAPSPSASPSTISASLDEASADIFAPSSQPERDAATDRNARAPGGREPDLFEEMASQAFGGEPVRRPLVPEAREAVDTQSTRSFVGSFSSVTSGDPIPTATPAWMLAWERLRGGMSSRLPPGWNIWSALGVVVGSVLLIVLLSFSARVLWHRAPASSVAPSVTVAPVVSGAQPSEHVVLPPDPYVD